MLKKLQRKFIILTTVISTVVLLFITLLINTLNYFSVINSSDNILEMFVDSDLELSEDVHPIGRYPKELAYTTRFFVVHVDENNTIDYIDLNNIKSVSAEEAVNYVNAVNNTKGTIDYFRYLKKDNPIGFTYIFLDIEEDMIWFENYLFFSVFIVLSSVVLIFFISVILSAKAVEPIVRGYEKQKRFITDVNHELKTPLSIIKTDCEVLEIDYGENEWTKSIVSQVNRLNMLVASLVSMAKLSENARIESKTEFSLSDTLNKTTSEFSSSFINSQICLKTDIKEDIHYIGEKNLISNLFSLLIENAIKYSLDKGEVSITLYEKMSKKYFIIQNECAEVSIGKHDNWFDRFYREDKSRNSKTKSFGIGLSIAKSICDKHKAKISIDSKTGKEIIVTVIF